jgi:hypothetical protein
MSKWLTVLHNGKNAWHKLKLALLLLLQSLVVVALAPPSG